MIDGGGGANILFGGNGNDRLQITAEVSTPTQDGVAYGGNGNDFISGASGNDRLDGSNGDDFLAGAGDNNFDIVN